MTAATDRAKPVAELAQSYRTALRRYLGDTSRAKPAAAPELGREAVRLGLDVLDLVAIHEGALIHEALATRTAGVRQRIVRRGASFMTSSHSP